MNIEVKGPRTAKLKSKYDCNLVVEGVLELAHKYEMDGKFFISSFNKDILEAAEIARRN